jgi:UDP-N-acetylmuramoyl-L-alanyl-D-glutamate--2,6-diaminopimelate ligase
LDGVVVSGRTDVEIESLEYDSRLVRKNSLFFAVKGFKSDGYDFVQQAHENGAVAVMGERLRCEQVENHIHVPDIRRAMAGISAKFYNYPGLKLTAYGVTGTNGKTTTCFLLRRILEQSGHKTGLITSLLYDTGEETFKAERTTPESLDLQRLLFLMTQNQCDGVVIEVSSHALALKRVENIEFLAAVFTNLTRDHLDFHKTMDNYLAAKASLLKKLDGESGCAVINLDVPEFRPLFGEKDTTCLSYSQSDTEADVYCRHYRLEADKTTFDLVTPIGVRTVTFHLPGRPNLMNAIAASAAGVVSGVDLEDIVMGLESAHPLPGRFNVVKAGQPFAVYVDYAHTPDALERLCQSIREISQGRLLLLFGCGGDRDRGKRPLMARAATTLADFAIATSDNPRSEDPMVILDEIKTGMKGNNYEIIPERREAIRAILKKAQPNDVVILAGKGAEPYQEIKGVRYPFDDRDEARKVLTELGYTATGADEEI